MHRCVSIIGGRVATILTNCCSFNTEGRAATNLSNVISILRFSPVIAGTRGSRAITLLYNLFRVGVIGPKRELLEVVLIRLVLLKPIAWDHQVSGWRWLRVRCRRRGLLHGRLRPCGRLHGRLRPVGLLRPVGPSFQDGEEPSCRYR